ncbi:MAG: 4-vinyl reductase [Planctomycetia bacterium]|nr:4-vinyl reductase [Planctomycetia bacterium]
MTTAEVAPGARVVPEQSLMRGNFFAESTYLKTDIAKGTTRNRAGTRIVCLTADFLHGLRRAVGDECGPAAELVFKSCGKKWGALFAKRFEQEMSEFYGKPLQDFMLALFQACLTELFSHHGWGKPNLDLSRHDRGLIVVEVKDAIYAELVGQSDQPVDTLLAGIFAGFFSYLSGQDLDCVQTTCKACGADASRFVLALAARLAPVPAWVQNGKGHEEILGQLAAVPA